MLRRGKRTFPYDLQGSFASAGKNILIFGQGLLSNTLLKTAAGYRVVPKPFRGVGHRKTNALLRPTRFIRRLSHTKADENVIMHVKPEHLSTAQQKRRTMDSRASLHTLQEDRQMSNHLPRWGMRQQTVSKYITEFRGVFHKIDDTVEEIRLTIPEVDFLSDYERRLGWLEAEQALLQRLPHQQINHEQHLKHAGQQQQTIDILAQLSLTLCPISIQLSKTTVTSSAGHLINRKQLQAASRAQGREWTL